MRCPEAESRSSLSDEMRASVGDGTGSESGRGLSSLRLGEGGVRLHSNCHGGYSACTVNCRRDPVVSSAQALAWRSTDTADVFLVVRGRFAALGTASSKWSHKLPHLLPRAPQCPSAHLTALVPQCCSSKWGNRRTIGVSFPPLLPGHPFIPISMLFLLTAIITLCTPTRQPSKVRTFTLLARPLRNCLILFQAVTVCMAGLRRACMGAVRLPSVALVDVCVAAKRLRSR